MIPIANFKQHVHKFLEIDQHIISSFLPLLFLLITILGYLSSFSKAFDFVEVRYGVIVHKKQEQLGFHHL
jgi:carbon starvation protein CstA